MQNIFLPLVLFFFSSASKADQMIRLGKPSPYILSAPHGSFDLHTGRIVQETCAALPQWGCIVVTGYRTRKIPINVNRPTEGISLPPNQESRTPVAEAVYRQYLSIIKSISNDPKWYIEIHGNARKKSASFIEIATIGLSIEQSKKIALTWTPLLHIHGLSEYTLLIEPLHKVHFSAEASKEFGSLSQFQPTLHIELPEALRFEKQEATVQFLQKALSVLPML